MCDVPEQRREIFSGSFPPRLSWMSVVMNHLESDRSRPMSLSPVEGPGMGHAAGGQLQHCPHQPGDKTKLVCRDLYIHTHACSVMTTLCIQQENQTTQHSYFFSLYLSANYTAGYVHLGNKTAPCQDYLPKRFGDM